MCVVASSFKLVVEFGPGGALLVAARYCCTCIGGDNVERMWNAENCWPVASRQRNAERPRDISTAFVALRLVVLEGAVDDDIYK